MPILANARHERFAQAVAKGKSATEAYRIAGYDGDRHHAARLATNGHVQSRVQEILAAGAQRAEVSVERVLREYARLGFSDIRKAVAWRPLVSEAGEDDDGVPITRTLNEVALIASDEIDPETALAISEISQTKDGGLKVKFHDKKGALDSMARYLGMFIDRSEVSTTVRDVTDEPITPEAWAETHVTEH